MARKKAPKQWQVSEISKTLIGLALTQRQQAEQAYNNALAQAAANDGVPLDVPKVTIEGENWVEAPALEVPNVAAS